MLNLTEERLATMGVTKGARHKIVLSVRKLRERYHTLCQLERDVVAGASLSQAMDDLRAVLCSPIKAVDEKDKDTNVEDIPEQFTKVMGKGMFLFFLFSLKYFPYIDGIMTNTFLFLCVCSLYSAACIRAC